MSSSLSGQSSISATGEGDPVFKDKLGLIFSCLGCVVGTGNIWRFPRIAANSSGENGGLQFLIIWICFLFLWSIPIIIVEYAVGRYTRKSTVQSFRELVSPWSTWCGAWMSAVQLVIACYYSVILGWCFYFLYHSIFFSLPSTKAESLDNWQSLQDTKWPIFLHFLSLLFSGLAVAKAVSSIELVNKIVVPLLLIILAFSFCWSLSLEYASYGISFLFTLDWAKTCLSSVKSSILCKSIEQLAENAIPKKFRDPRVWVDAASQNAWDTGAGAGLFLTYATFMTRQNSVVKIGTLLPACNNLVSLLSCITTFSTVFSVEMRSNTNTTAIVALLKDNGPANTGLTFIWMPLLYHRLGTAGRVLCCLFFLCLSFAGVSSLVAMVELTVHTFSDLGVRRVLAVPVTLIVMFLGGLPSAVDLNILVNQDFVWGFAMIIAGLMTATLPIRVGTARFRKDIVNTFGTDDWTLPRVWEYIIKFIVPLEAAALLLWFVVDTIRDDKTNWYQMDTESFMNCIVQWLVVFLLLILSNVIWMRWRRSTHSFFRVSATYGSTDSEPK